MKSEVEIQFKIVVHESKINEMIKTEKWPDFYPELIHNYLMGRKALLWVLSPDDALIEDEFERIVNFEISCYDAAKIL